MPPRVGHANWRADRDPMVDRRNLSSGGPWEDTVGYSRAVRIGNRILVSGTTAVGDAGEIIGQGDAREQTMFVLRQIEQALHQCGATLGDVVRTRMFVTDIENWEPVADAHREVFADIRPAATMVEVSRLIDPGMLVEIEADAEIPA